MKRLIYSALGIAIFCVGLGSLVERAGARFKSDEKALAVIRDCRQAIGGESALAAIRSLVINGQTTKTLRIDGADKTIQGETEIAMQLPDKLMKMMKVGHDDGMPGDKQVQRQVDVVVVGDKAKEGEWKTTSPEAGQNVIIKRVGEGDGEKVILRKGDADKGQVEIEHNVTTRDGDHVMIKRAGGAPHEAMRQNEMLGLTLGLLLTAPQGVDVNYTFAGETDIDGTACNVVVCQVGDASYKLFIGKSSNLPVAMTFRSMRMPVMMFHTKAPEGGESKGNVMFTTKVDAPPVETAEFTVKFSDFRSVGGLQLPYRWTQTVGGATDEVFDIASYDVNPANIADKFNNDKVRVKIKED